MGRVNDVTLYRELTRRGVSEYLMTPVNTIDVVRAVCHLFSAPDAKPVGRIVAIVGAKGGVGASTVAHNVAWASDAISQSSRWLQISIFPSVPPVSITIRTRLRASPTPFSSDRVDTAFVDRLLSKCTDHLSLLAAPATLDRVYDFGAEAFDSILDLLRATIPCVVLDVPHQWAGWTRRLLVSADEILVVAGPDLANLRNAKISSICCVRHGRTIIILATASTRSAFPSARKSPRPTLQRRLKQVRSRSFRSSRSCLGRPPTTVK